MRLAIADPPYLGRAELWYGGKGRSKQGPSGRACGRGQLDAEFHPEPLDENPVLAAMTEYAQAIRGDWNGFDGRSEKRIIDGWVQELRQPDPSHDIEWHRRDLGICMAGGGHWCGYWGHCDDECGCLACVEDRSAR